jgi:putative ABC transport system permease protein
MIKNFLKSTFRNLLKNKGYSFLNIGGLAIGIACAGLIFLWVADELTFDNVNVNKDSLYSILVNAKYNGNTFTMGSTPRIMAKAIKAEIPGIVNTCRVSDEGQNLLFSIGDKSMYATGKYADASLFSMFTLPFVQGNAGSAFSPVYSIVITEKTAEKFFGSEKNVIGKTVRVDNKQDYVVTGVLKNLPQNSTLQFEWVSSYETDFQHQMAMNGNYYATHWNSYGPFTYVELDSKAKPDLINKQLHNYIHGKDATQTNTSFLFPMRDWHLYNEFENGKQTGGGAIKQVRLLSIIAWIILFIACVNFMNLATARSEKRAKEVGVRKVMGAARKGLIAHFLGEALFMSMLSAICAVVIMILALPAFNLLVQKQLSLGFGDPSHIIALAIIILISGLVAGSYPSFYLSSFNPVNVLKGLKIKTGSAAFVRKGLAVLQFTVSVVFIISSIIIYQQIQHVKSRDLGFNKDNMIEVDMQRSVTQNFPLIKQDLLNTGLVENTAMADHSTIYGGNSDNRFNWPGKAKFSDVEMTFRNVSPEFVSTSGMHIIQGRDFGNITADSSNVIITQSLANIIDKNGVIGKIIQSPRGRKDGGYENLTIVGVVSDYVYGNMFGQSGPVIFFCKQSFRQNAHLLYLRIKGHQISQQTLAKIAAVIKKDNPQYPFQYKFVDDQFNAMFSGEILMSKLSGIFATLAIIISCLGLFGLAAYTAERRLKEIGIRKVLGASVPGIAGLLSKDFLQLVGISCLAAFPLAGWIMHNWLQGYQYRTSIHWWIFAIAGLCAMLIALITVSYQAIKAALANPVNSLHSE